MTRRDHTVDAGSAVPHRPAKNPAGGVRTVWQSLSAAVGAVLGLVPHVLHHIGLVAGAAVVTGIGGSAVLYLLGLVFSIPMLRRLWRRFHSWRALAAAVTVFTALFLVSALVIGPAISGESAPEAPPGPEPSATHSEHHEGP